MKALVLALSAALALALAACASDSKKSGTSSSGGTSSTTSEIKQDSKDTWLTTKVKSAIFQEPNLKSAEINVETYKGVVQLSGATHLVADGQATEER